MLTVEEAFQKFKTRLEITKTEQRIASDRQQTLRSQVESGIGVEHDFLIGAYARDTKTKPLRDVDILVELAEAERDYRNKSPRAVLEAVRAILVPKYSEAQVSIDRFCVRVDFALPNTDDFSEDVLSFDVVPAFAEQDVYMIPDDRQGIWITTSPDVHASMTSDANKAFSGHWKPLVKMIKKWNDHNGHLVEPSFLLEVMALQLLDPPWGGSYPYELKQFFASAADRIGDGWPDPAKAGPDVSDILDADKQKMHAAVQSLRAAEATCSEAIRLDRSGNTGGALAAWQRLFGPTFAKS